MAETFDSYLKKMMDNANKAKAEQSTFEWYLKQVRDLAASTAEGNQKQVPSSGIAVEKSKEANTQSLKADLRTYVEKEAAIETTTGFNMGMVGKMLFYRYDAKTKAKLPYWDQFPLIFPFKVSGNYMLGMNMHYLPPVERARLMYALFTTINSETLDVNSKLLITYKTLVNSSKFENFRPCIKKYLGGQIRSRVMVINPKQWNQVVYMPLANFMKASQYKVWNDSIDIIRKAGFKNK